MCHQVANKLRILRAFANDVLDLCLKNLTIDVRILGGGFNISSKVENKDEEGAIWDVLVVLMSRFECLHLCNL